MEVVALFPALLFIVGYYRWGLKRTFLWVSLPVLTLLPDYFSWKSANFPNVDFIIAMLMPLGLALTIPVLRRWEFRRTDIWLSLFVFSSFYHDMTGPDFSLGKYRAFYAVTKVLIPYVAGRLLIEQAGLRVQAVKGITLSLLLSAVLAAPEFVVKWNLWRRVWVRFFPGQEAIEYTQSRGGFGRASGPLNTAEAYGMMLIVGICFWFWAYRYFKTHRAASSTLESSVFRRGPLAAIAAFFATLVMTQSRGPWAGTLLAVPVALIGRARHTGRVALTAACLLLVVSVPAVAFFDSYTSGKRTDFGSPKETAQYRRELLENYIPIAQEGGLWGWGTFPPIVRGQNSIDNEFLLIYLTQGLVGFGTIVLLIVESSVALVRIGTTASTEDDRAFAFSILGILLGWCLTLATVYLAGQTSEVLFLLIGWTQAIVPQSLPEAQEAPSPVMAIRVYT